MRRALVTLALVCGGLGAATAAPALAAHVPHGPAGAAFYRPPHLAPGHAHGGLLRARRLHSAAVLPGARNELLLYRSIGVHGRPVAVSGTVAIPRGKAPKGGWPVITYAHGTTGDADSCAPSRDRATAPVHPFNAYIYPLLERWLKAGYVVVRTDYEGLGTPGVHPYLQGRSEGRSTLDMVRAARHWAPSLSRRVVIAGHSQGGHAALWAAALAPRWTPELHVRGTVAFAPASHLSEQSAFFSSLSTPGGGLSGIVALLARGLDATYPALHVRARLSPAARALYPQTLKTCLPELSAANSFGGLAPAALFRSSAAVTGLAPALDRGDPENLRITTRVLVEQGESDTTVFPTFTGQLVHELRHRGTKLRYRTYPGVSHGGVVVTAATDATSWIRGRLPR